MPILVRSHNGGKSFELRVIHPQLPKPVYRTFDYETDARRAGELAVVALDRGERPPWLQRSEERAFSTLAHVVRAYRGITAVAPSTDDVLDTLLRYIGAVAVQDINYA